MKTKKKLKYDRFCINDVLSYIDEHKKELTKAYKKAKKKERKKENG